MSGCGGVAILTSGGDAPGMNAAVRAVIRYLDLISAGHSVLTISNQLCVSLKSGFLFPDPICADHIVVTGSN